MSAPDQCANPACRSFNLVRVNVGQVPYPVRVLCDDCGANWTIDSGWKLPKPDRTPPQAEEGR